MKLTVKKLKEYLSKLNDTDVLDFVGANKVVKISEEVLFDSNRITDKIKANIPTKFVIPLEYMNYLNWNNSFLTETKINNFVKTLLNVWNPYTDIKLLNHTKLNNTTLSRALFITKTKAAKVNVKAKEYNIDNIINDIIMFNLAYLQSIYDKLNKYELEHND